MFTNWTRSTWMKNVADTTRIYDITIPGTHESCALSGPTGWHICQYWSIREQLDHGIRYLDIRCGYKDGKLQTCHESTYQSASFEQVLHDCLIFLGNHDQEFIFMRIRHEDGSADDFKRECQKVVAKFPDLFHNDYTVDENAPLSKVRGRIIPLSNGPGVDGRAWAGGGSGRHENLYMINQDFYSASAWRPSHTKFDDHVRPFLDEAAGSTNKRKLHINHLSATGADTPFVIAADDPFSNGVNHLTKDHIYKKSGPAFGIVAMDFADLPEAQGDWLIHDLIQRNYGW